MAAPQPRAPAGRKAAAALAVVEIPEAARTLAARIATAQAAIETVRRRLPRLTTSEETAFANSLLGQYEQRLQRYSANAERRIRLDAQQAAERRIWLAAIAAERAELMQMRETDVINDEVLRRLQVDLDLEETRITGAARNAI
jgi:CPA1 family monovalent cation:H+ antiporter